MEVVYIVDVTSALNSQNCEEFDWMKICVEEIRFLCICPIENQDKLSPAFIFHSNSTIFGGIIAYPMKNLPTKFKRVGY